MFRREQFIKGKLDRKTDVLTSKTKCKQDVWLLTELVNGLTKQ